MNKNQGFSSVFGIILILIIIIGGGAYWYSQNKAVTPAPDDTSGTAQLDTANWQTYSNEEYGFEFKYPNDNLFNIQPFGSFDDYARLNLRLIDQGSLLPSGSEIDHLELVIKTKTSDYFDSESYYEDLKQVYGYKTFYTSDGTQVIRTYASELACPNFGYSFRNKENDLMFIVSYLYSDGHCSGGENTWKSIKPENEEDHLLFQQTVEQILSTFKFTK